MARDTPFPVGSALGMVQSYRQEVRSKRIEAKYHSFVAIDETHVQ